MDKEQMQALLKLPIDTKYYDQYKEAYKYITGKDYRGTCTKCGLRAIYKLMQRHVLNN